MVYSGRGTLRPRVTATHSQLLKRSPLNKHSPGLRVLKAAGYRFQLRPSFYCYWTEDTETSDSGYEEKEK